MAISIEQPEPPRRQRGSRTLIVAGAASALVVLALVYWSFNSARRPVNDHATKTDEPTTPQLTQAAVDNPRGYVGIQVCQSCHAERVKEFKTTRHYLACMPPNPAEMPAEFATGKGRLDTADPNIHFEMVKVGESYVQKTLHTRPNGQTDETLSNIAFVYGQGGTADQVYFGWHDNRLYELPVARLLPQNEWGASKFDRNGEGDFSREATPRCLECHNVWFKQTPGSLNEYDRQDIMLGVTCEKCHGPGKEHVAWHKAHPAAKGGKEIVHPGHLSRELQMAVCGQCHSNAPKYSAPPFSYKPGEPLDRYFKTLHSRYPEEDHVANQDQYLRESKCYQQSETLTCITCHDPHHREESGAAARQKTCLQCHAPDKCPDRPNLPAEVRDNCTGCHMPLVTKMQVHFFTAKEKYVPPAGRYEHRIGIYPRKRQELLLNWRRKQNDPESREEAKKLEQDLGRDWIAYGDELRGAYRFLAAIDAYRQAVRIHPTPAAQEKLASVLKLNSEVDNGWFRVSEEIEKKDFAKAAKTLEEVLALKPDLAQAHGRLGAVYASLGEKEKAREHLEAVSRFDPDEPAGESMLGWLAYLDGQHGEALEHYRRAEVMEPWNFKVTYNLGLAHLGLRQWQEAGSAFTKVLAIDPKHAGAFQGMSHALRGQGQNTGALTNALRAAELSKFENADILLSLADAYADAGRLREAQNTANRALAASKGGNPQLISRIVERIEELRSRGSGSR